MERDAIRQAGMTGAFPWPLTQQQHKEAADILRELVGLVEDDDGADPERLYATLTRAVAVATSAGFTAGMVEDYGDQVVYIDLPSGQVSWSVPLAYLPTICVDPRDEHHAQRVADFLRVDS